MIDVLNFFQKAPYQITGNFYVYMAIFEGLLESGKYKFDHHDVMIYFYLKESTNKFFVNEEGVYEGVMQSEEHNSL